MEDLSPWSSFLAFEPVGRDLRKSIPANNERDPESRLLQGTDALIPVNVLFYSILFLRGPEGLTPDTGMGSLQAFPA
jgi:hypothetical protein